MVNKIIEKIKTLLQKSKQRSVYDRCYTAMEYRGVAVFGCCDGLAGGDKLSGYLQYECIGCPYFVDTSK